MSKRNRQIIALLAMALFSFPINAQTNYAVLEKNLNVRAKDLIHELNSTKDSLLIQSTSRIKYIYSINEDYQREIFTYVGKNKVKVALDNLSLGKHVMVVNHKAQLIVFVLKIFAEEPELLAVKDTDDIASNK